MIRYLTILSLVIFSAGCAPVAAVTAGKVGSIALEERKAGDVVSDTVLKAKIESSFMQSSFSNIFYKVTVDVNEGKVLLTGSVPSADHKIRAIQLTWGIDGVKEVLDELEVADKPVKTSINDKWIATQVRTKMFMHKDVSSINYTVSVNNGVVYVIGIAHDDKELQDVMDTISTIKGVQKVVNYVRVK